MDFDFKVPSTIPQDLLLIQDIIGDPPPTAVGKHHPDSTGSSDDDIASTDGEVESEDEVEADLAPRDEESALSVAPSDSESHSDSDSDSSSSPDSEEGLVDGAPERQRHAGDIEDEESGVMEAPGYLQTKNEIVETNIMVPIISEVEPFDTLEKVGEIMSIVGNIVIVKGIPADHLSSLSERALDAESLLVFEDRKVFGYVYETFGPTSQPLYQVIFNRHYPLDTDKVWLSREVFHVPQRSHFVFVDQLKNLRGSDASNIHDEEPEDDEIEFSDDEKEAAFRAERKRRRGRSVSSSRHSTPAPSRVHADDMSQTTYRGSNPYDAHGPYDDDYHATRPSRPSPVPYDDPYADVPISDVCVPLVEMDTKFGGAIRESGEVGPKASRGRIARRGTRGRGDRNHQPRTSRREYLGRHKPAASQRTQDPDTHQPLPTTSRMVERATGYGHVVDGTTPYPYVQPTSNAWFSPDANHIQNYRQPFVQPHINPRFASAFGLNLPSGVMVPRAPQNPSNDHTPQPLHWANTWTMQSSTGAESEEDAYRPL